MSPPEMPWSPWGPPEAGPPARPHAPERDPRERRIARLVWAQAGLTLLLASIGNVEMPSWRENPAAPLARSVVALAVATLPVVPAFWAVILLRAVGERGRRAAYAVGGLILSIFQGMALLPYVQ